MYEVLRDSLKEVDNNKEYSLNDWQEYIMEDTIDILNNFSEDDWQKLFKEIPQKSIIWKRHFAECLTNFKDKNQFKALVYLFNIDDINLLEILITQILNYNFNDINSILKAINNSDEILERIKSAIPSVSEGYRENFIIFLKNSDYSESVRSK